MWAFLDSFTVTHGGKTNGDFFVCGAFFICPGATLQHRHWHDDREMSSNTAPFVPAGHSSRHFYTLPPPLPQL